MKEKLKNTFGLAISDTALTAVEMTSGKAGLRILNYSRVELEPGIIQDNCIVINPEAFKNAMSKLLLDAKNGPITSRNVIIGICEEKTFGHYINIPKNKAKDDEFIKNSAKDYIPIALDDAVIDYKEVINGTNGGKATFNLVATQKNIINSLIETFEEINLKVIAIDASKNAITRAYENRFHKNDGDFMIVNIDITKSLLNICTSSGFRYDIDVKIGGHHFDEKIKEILQLATNVEVHKLLMQFYKDKNSIKPEQQEVIQKGLQEYFKPFIEKITELTKAVENQQAFNLSAIYLMGCHSCVPGLKEVLQKAFPKTEIKHKLEYIELDEETELFYIEAIGLALRSVLPEVDENDVNLLPKNKKYQLYVSKITPSLKGYLLILCLLLGSLLVFSGIFTTKAFTDYRISAQEAKLLTEKTLNPYLTEAARAKQSKTQLENQIMSILMDSVPGSQIIKKIDSYNRNGTSMINSTLKVAANKDINIRLRAKISSREDTENFIMELEQDPYYLEVISPLSNLVGQGERFVNIDLKVDSKTVIDDFMEASEKIIEDLDESDRTETKPVAPDTEGEIAEEIPSEENSDENVKESDNKTESKKPSIQTKTETADN